MQRAVVLSTVLFLAGCNPLTANVTAQTALKWFCGANDADLLSFLVTPEQKHAATILCRLLGYQLGTPDPIPDPLAGKP